MASIIQVRRDTAANWTAANPLLASGELGFETNTYKLKIGDAINLWNALPYTYQEDLPFMVGTAELDFGATPTDEATVVVTGLTDMTTSAAINVYIVGDDTTVDNTAVDHDGFTYMANVHAGARVAGVGFTITGRVWNGLVSGKFKVHYSYTV